MVVAGGECVDKHRYRSDLEHRADAKIVVKKEEGRRKRACPGMGLYLTRWTRPPSGSCHVVSSAILGS
jgi:hypothetical protein